MGKSLILSGQTNNSIWFWVVKPHLSRKIVPFFIVSFRLGAFSTTTFMLSILQRESSVGPIYSDDLFRSVILMKKTTISPSKPDMPIGFALSEDTSHKLDVTRTSYSVLGHGKETVYAWKAFFFL